MGNQGAATWSASTVLSHLFGSPTPHVLMPPTRAAARRHRDRRGGLGKASSSLHTKLFFGRLWDLTSKHLV